MTSHGFAELLTQLGVERGYSQPRVSNDNPLSESHFHTVQSQPDYPGQFVTSRAHARGARAFFVLCNTAHHQHSSRHDKSLKVMSRASLSAAKPP
jgi:putative transposase